jgi:hypothetical protein
MGDVTQAKCGIPPPPVFLVTVTGKGVNGKIWENPVKEIWWRMSARKIDTSTTLPLFSGSVDIEGS